MIIQPIYITVHQLFSPTTSIDFVGIFLFFSSLFSILPNNLIFEKRLVCLTERCIIENEYVRDKNELTTAR